jgi:hypothetical protein
MARQRNSLAAARVGARRECGGLIGGEGQLQDPRVGFIEREGGEGATTGSNGLKCDGGPAALIAIKGGALIEMKRKRLMGEGGSRGFSAS